MGDFGLTGKSGGTPMFMAPEGLDKDFRIVGKTDLYSFAVTVLFMLFPAELAIKLLFLPIENLKERQSFVESLSHFDLLLWIFKSLSGDPKSRIDLDDWKAMIEKLKNNKITENKFTVENLEEKGVDLTPLHKASENEAGLLFYIKQRCAGNEKFPGIPIPIPQIPGNSGNGNEKSQSSHYSRNSPFPGNGNEIFRESRE